MTDFSFLQTTVTTGVSVWYSVLFIKNRAQDSNILQVAQKFLVFDIVVMLNQDKK